MMETMFRELAGNAALILEVVSVIIIIVGAVEAVGQCLWPFLLRRATQGVRRKAWLSFARWLLLGLEFTLAADIIRSAIAPNWTDIGQLAAIAAIRTFLNYFLERDLKESNMEAA